MTEFTVREYSHDDLTGIRGIWSDVFGDGERVIASLLDNLCNMGTAAVCDLDGEIIGFALALAGQELIYADSFKRPIVGYIYAVAVSEKCRSKGVGAALVKKTTELLKERGATVIATLPAQESLYRWYEKNIGLHFTLGREKRTVDCSDIEPAAKLSSTEYLLWRDMLLKGKNYLRPSNYTMEAFKQFCEALGGGLYACGTGIAAGYIEDGTARIVELISADEGNTEEIAASVGKLMGSERAEFFVPFREGKAYIVSDRELPRDCFWNITFE